MSSEYAWPSSSGLEFEARRMHATADAESVADASAALAMARLPGLFDLSACLIAAALVFPQLFFPGMAHVWAVALGVALAVAPLALAPAGRALAGPLARRHGAGVGYTAAHFLIGASSAAVAVLPSAASVGPAALALLCACRVLQGLAFGAAWGGSVDTGSAMARANRLGAAFAAAAALLLAGVLFGLLWVLAPDDLPAWGWRYPFVAVFALSIVGLFARLRLLATPDREQALQTDRRGRPVLGVVIGGRAPE